VTWDRRRADRRTETSGTDRRRAESALGRFEAYLDLKLGALERSVAIAAGEVGAEAKEFKGASDTDAIDAEKIDGRSDRTSRALEAIAEEISQLRGELGSANRAGDGDGVEAPSEGAELLVRQMAIAGADATEIERRLETLGMEHPREAIEAVLAEPK
jgi:hypothetical protein